MNDYDHHHQIKIKLKNIFIILIIYSFFSLSISLRQCHCLQYVCVCFFSLTILYRAEAWTSHHHNDNDQIGQCRRPIGQDFFLLMNTEIKATTTKKKKFKLPIIIKKSSRENKNHWHWKFRITGFQKKMTYVVNTCNEWTVRWTEKKLVTTTILCVYVNSFKDWSTRFVFFSRKKPQYIYIVWVGETRPSIQPKINEKKWQNSTYRIKIPALSYYYLDHKHFVAVWPNKTDHHVL